MPETVTPKPLWNMEAALRDAEAFGMIWDESDGRDSFGRQEVERFTCTLADFLRDNSDTVTLRDLQALLMSGSVQGGGGAGPQWAVALHESGLIGKGPR